VLDHGGHAGARRGGGPVREILSLGVAGIHEVDMGVDHARHHERARGVERLGGVVPVGRDRGDPAVADVDVRGPAGVAGHDLASHDAEIHPEIV